MNLNNVPLLSVIIPTRARKETLRAYLPMHTISPIVHPERIELCVEADARFYNLVTPTFFRRLSNKFLKLPTYGQCSYKQISAPCAEFA